jgi:hypothetical protein
MRTKGEATCIWCGCPFSLRVGGGKKQRFCCTAHRSRYWRALRKWASRVFEAGLISVDDLRRTQAETLVGAATVLRRGRNAFSEQRARRAERPRTSLMAHPDSWTLRAGRTLGIAED